MNFERKTWAIHYERNTWEIGYERKTWVVGESCENAWETQETVESMGGCDT
jgi:hypothetical protein